MDDTKARERSELARRVAKMMRTSPDFRHGMKVTAEDGSCPVVVALLTDRVSDLYALVRRDHPEGANVVVGEDKGFVVLSVTHDADERGFGEIETDCPIHGDSEVGMLVAYAVVHPGAPVRCQVTMSGYEVEASAPVAV